MAKKKQNNFFSNLNYSRKMEVAGILIMAVAGLLLLSIASYNPTDYAVVKSLNSSSIFQIDQGPALRISNWLGMLGAYISYTLVHTLFGYTSIIIPIIIASLGWFVFRQNDLGELGWPAAYGLWVMVLASTIFGWFYNRFEAYSMSWSGNSGIYVAGILENILGLGSIILLLVLMFVSLLILADRDLQKTFEVIQSWKSDWKSKREQKRKEKNRKKEEKKREKEERAVIQQRQKADAAMKKEEKQKQSEKNGEPASIDDIVERSQKEDEEREARRKKESAELEKKPPRAILEKKPEETVDEEDDDVEISVYVGEGDEEASDKELDRLNKSKAKEVPVIKYKFPGIDLLTSPPNEGNEVDLEEIKENKRIILDKLKRHKIEILGINAIVGPTVTLYELEPAPDVKISKIESYANDLKMATAAHGLRIIAPIPGRSAVGIEVPNSSRETVFIKSVINTKKFVETDYELPVAFGKTIENEVFMIDLTRMPHLLIAGATGSGKSVGINTIITCLLYKCHPDDLKFVMIDPKKIELSLYRNIQNHYLAVLPGSDEPIVTDTTRAMETLESVTKEMDERYDLLKMAMVRDIKSYNEKYDTGELDDELGHRHLPYIVVVIDELADLMMTAGKQIEEPIARLAQLARAIGIHLVVATQRPSVNVITGTIKANFPARIAYQVASKVDSRTILDTGGADQLIGRGDMLFSNGGGMTRIQNAYVDTDEVERITSFIGSQKGFKKPFQLPVIEEENEGIPDPLDDIDDYFKEAAKIVVLHQQGSVSLLQRKLKIGYNRAGRIIDQLYNAGVVGPYQGSTARDVKIEDEEDLEEIFEELGV
ncbi:DNA translocase FtsK [Rhodohalobacter barkolensis]|uniref:DNA translocase FtsK n=1 Tax=Rhodohalobacter barkolensis TaxID=2053187 RepID=A0A2N0VGR2_9BACT|nr:DNA translocase FtsK 4TM domain-containing protein [Rhodohalobacter barkolensis]PKD43392.1 DNA translocase FtsK [Rhodohalobacter barkolensis]